MVRRSPQTTMTSTPTLSASEFDWEDLQEDAIPLSDSKAVNSLHAILESGHPVPSAASKIDAWNRAVVDKFTEFRGKISVSEAMRLMAKG